MARYKPKAKKLRLAAKRKQTKWAPFWLVPKMFKGIKKIHPSKFTKIKRSWRRNNTKA